MEITKDLNAILKKHLSEFEARIERSFKIQLESSIAGLKEEFNGLLTTKAWFPYDRKDRQRRKDRTIL